MIQITELKLHADAAQVEKIERKNGNLFITLTPAASQRISGENVFAALSVTKLRATVAESNDKMHIKLVIQPQMTQQDWFEQLMSYVKKLAEYLWGSDLKKITEQKAMRGAFILSVAAIIAKVLSAVYRIPLQNLVGNTGFYVYQQIYPIYGIGMTFALNGYPNFISKIIAEELMKKEN